MAKCNSRWRLVSENIDSKLFISECGQFAKKVAYISGGLRTIEYSLHKCEGVENETRQKNKESDRENRIHNS